LAKSQVPCSPVPSIRSTRPAACAVIRSFSAATARGVNDFDNIRRSLECSGGSMFSIIRRT
jgi:hypothetical protein